MLFKQCLKYVLKMSGNVLGSERGKNDSGSGSQGLQMKLL